MFKLPLAFALEDGHYLRLDGLQDVGGSGGDGWIAGFYVGVGEFGEGLPEGGGVDLLETGCARTGDDGFWLGSRRLWL